MHALRSFFVLLAAALLLGSWPAARALEPAAGSAAALRAKHLELQPQLRSNAFGEPLVLVSRELPERLEGDVYAEVAYSFGEVGAAFRSASTVCDLMFLHQNVRSCKPSADGEAVTLVVGPKRASAPGMQYRMSYALRTEMSDAEHLRVTLGAAQGPLSTHDYRMVFEAVPIDARRSFVHFGYAYGYGTLAKLAMQAYLATAGRTKIGFTVVGQEADGRPRYAGGERGSLERNVMRYYLALLARCSVTTGSPDELLQARMRAWFALTERYAAQLHEYDLAEYLKEKRDDLARDAAAR